MRGGHAPPNVLQSVSLALTTLFYTHSIRLSVTVVTQLGEFEELGSRAKLIRLMAQGRPVQEHNLAAPSDQPSSAAPFP